MAAKKRRKQTHACNGSLCFHGAFGTRAKAETKKSKTRGAWIVGKMMRRIGWRYLVVSEDKSGLPF